MHNSTNEKSARTIHCSSILSNVCMLFCPYGLTLATLPISQSKRTRLSNFRITMTGGSWRVLKCRWNVFSWASSGNSLSQPMQETSNLFSRHLPTSYAQVFAPLGHAAQSSCGKYSNFFFFILGAFCLIPNQGSWARTGESVLPWRVVRALSQYSAIAIYCDMQ